MRGGEAEVVGEEVPPGDFRVDRVEDSVDRFLLGRVEGGLGDYYVED